MTQRGTDRSGLGTATKLGAYGLALAAMLGGGAFVGSAIGPDPSEPAPTEQSPPTPSEPAGHGTHGG